MNRRDFIKLAALTGACVSPQAFAHEQSPPAQRYAMGLRRSSEPYDGPFYVFVTAVGGWDSVMLCDPKGRDSDAGNISPYVEGEIETAGNIRYAPIGNNRDFFQKYYNRLTVINGIDTATNNHEAGLRAMFSGRLGPGNASLPALLAGIKDPSRPMSFLSFGGFDRTDGVVARTQVGSFDGLTRVAYPNRQDPRDADSPYHDTDTIDLINQARTRREAQLTGKGHLPRSAQMMDMMFTARAGAAELKSLQQYLPSQFDSSSNILIRQAQLAVAAYRAGLCVSVGFRAGGFDTHDNHDALHPQRMTVMLEGVDFIMEEAERAGIADRVIMVMASDFGRTPTYNGGAGKDHWPITSLMCMGNGIPGNRVIGGTDAGLNGLWVDPDTLAVSESGAPLTVGEIHHALRDFTGILDDELAQAFPIDAIGMPLLS